MKHEVTRSKERFEYRFELEELLDILVQYLHSEHWEVPHQEDTASRELIRVNGHWELIVEKHLSKEIVPSRPVRQFPKPVEKPEPKNPMIVDMTDMTPDEIFEMARMKEDLNNLRKQQAEAMAAGAKEKPAAYKVTPLKETPEEKIVRLEDETFPRFIARAALSRAKGFFSRDLADEIGATTCNQRNEVCRILQKMTQEGFLQRKPCPIPRRRRQFQYLVIKK